MVDKYFLKDAPHGTVIIEPAENGWTVTKTRQHVSPYVKVAQTRKELCEFVAELAPGTGAERETAENQKTRNT